MPPCGLHCTVKHLGCVLGQSFSIVILRLAAMQLVLAKAGLFCTCSSPDEMSVRCMCVMCLCLPYMCVMCMCVMCMCQMCMCGMCMCDMCVMCSTCV